MRIESKLRQLLANEGIQATYGKRPLGKNNVETNFFRLSHAFPSYDAYKRPVFRFNVWSTRLATARATADIIIERFHRLKLSEDGIDLYTSHVVSEAEVYDDDNRMFQIPIDLQIAYREK